MFLLFQVDEIDGRTIAVQYGCQFHEISVAENSQTIYTAVDVILTECRQLQSTQNKTRKFSVSKMIGTLIGSTNGKGSQNTSQGGTVVVCHKSDLYKSRVLKRRQNFTATASLWLSDNNEQEGAVRWKARESKIFEFRFVRNEILIGARRKMVLKRMFCDKILFWWIFPIDPKLFTTLIILVFPVLWGDG